ncbi:hypothetical protein D9615_002186 [Tricholomella constricta]|uniref:Uncharacterized protein n=1 Tax=Tricholomella constricta TaxID=117010 RepID=A0A8H5M9A9_9AGAR|nr:hypothetical protein D9615_002186 [Tricholomella constricta]
MLYQMLLHTPDYFRAAQLQVSPKAPEYFDTNCQLKKNPLIFQWSIKGRFDELKILSGEVVSDEEAIKTMELMERCLRLDPANRSTAAELLDDRWFSGVE